MIGSSGNVNSGGYHKHEVTKCLHESRIGQFEAGGKMAAGINASSSQLRQEQKAFSLQEWLTGGLQTLFARASGFWNRLGEEGRNVQEENALEEGKRTGSAAAEGIAAVQGPGMHSSLHSNLHSDLHSGTVSPAEDAAVAVLASGVIKPEQEKREAAEETERRVKNVEGAVNGGLKKQQGGIRGFFQKFGETAAKAGHFFKKKKKEELAPFESNGDFVAGDNSFLLDSYNREGEYSTLAKDRSLEGSFRAKG